MASSLIDQVRHALPRGIEILSNPPEVGHADLLVHTGAGFAFFRVVGPNEDLVVSWRTVQNEIARYLSRLSQKGAREGAYLALLVEGQRDPVVLQRIAANPYVCRKVVVPSYQGLNVGEVVDELPFFPLPDRVQKTIRRPPVDPLIVASGTGLASTFVEHLLESRGPERLRTDLLAGLYDELPDAIPAIARSPVQGREASASDRLFVRQVHLQGFRNYGGAGKTIPLVGNLVVIYGRNGTGKTSLCEALEWGLTGRSHRADRLRDKEQQTGVARSPLLHLLHGEDGAQVDLWLEGPGSLHLHRVLTEDHESRHLNDREVSERDILRALSLLADDETLPRVGDVLRDVMRHCHFLSQETIQQFLGNDPEERYRAYTYMVGTQNLLRLIEKGTRVTKQLEGELSAHQQAAAQLDGLIRERLLRKEERRQALGTAELERLPDEATLVAQVNVLTRAAGGAGITLEVPELTAVKRAKVVAQTLTQSVPGRVATVQQDLARVERLAQETAGMSELLARRQVLEAQANSLAEAEQERVETADTQESLRISAASTLRDRTDEWNETQRRVEQVNRYLTLQDDLALLEGERAGTEESLAALEVERAQLGESLRRLRSDQRDGRLRLQRLRTDADSRTASHAELQRLADRLSEWQEKVAEQKRFQARWLRLKAESQDLAERLITKRKAWQELRTLVEQRSSALAEARGTAQRRQELLAELKGHLGSEESACPFCGHAWESNHQLLTGIQSMLERLPDGLKEAQEAHDQAVARRNELTDALAVGELTLGATKQELGVCEQRLEELCALIRQAEERAAPFYPGRSLDSLTPDEVRENLARGEGEAQLANEHVAAAEEALAAISDAIQTVEGQELASVVLIQQKQERLAQIRRRLEQIEGALLAMGSGFSDREEARAESTQRQGEAEAARLRVQEARQAADLAQAKADEAHRALAVLRAERAATQEELDAVIRRVRTHAAELEQIGVRATEPDIQLAQLAREKRRLAQQLANLTDLVTVGERLLAHANAFELVQAIQELDRDVERLRLELAGEVKAGERLADYLERVRRLVLQASDLRASEERERLDGFAGMIRVLYQRLCSHPYFGPLDLEIDSRAQRLYVRFHPGEGKSAAVSRYFSMAQSNAVALSIFLGTALLQSWSRLGIICVDDPVQHMDDMNTYAFLDLLRTVLEGGRQIVLTTASEELYRTMVARFAPLNQGGATVFQAFRLIGVTPEGPEILHDLPAEGVSL